MSERPIPIREEDRARQREVLTELWKASGLKMTPAAARIGISTSQFSRYLSGETILPTPYYRLVAETFGITRGELARRFGLFDDDHERHLNAPVFRRALRGVAPEWLLDELAPDFEDANEEAQRSAAVDVAEMIRDAIRKITPDLNESLRRNRSA